MNIFNFLGDWTVPILIVAFLAFMFWVMRNEAPRALAAMGAVDAMIGKGYGPALRRLALSQFNTGVLDASIYAELQAYGLLPLTKATREYIYNRLV